MERGVEENEKEESEKHRKEGSLSLSPFRTTGMGGTPDVRTSTVTPSSPSTSSPSFSEGECGEAGIEEVDGLTQVQSKVSSTFQGDLVLPSSATTTAYLVGASSEVVEEGDRRANGGEAEKEHHPYTTNDRDAANHAWSGNHRKEEARDPQERDGEVRMEAPMDEAEKKKKVTVPSCSPIRTASTSSTTIAAAAKTAPVRSLPHDSPRREKEGVASFTFPTGERPSSPLDAPWLNSTASPVSSPMQSLTTPAYPIPSNKTLEESPTRLRRVREKKDPPLDGLSSPVYSPLSFSTDDTHTFSPSSTPPHSQKTSPQPAYKTSSSATSPAADMRWTSPGAPPHHMHAVTSASSTAATRPESSGNPLSSHHLSDGRSGSRNGNGSRAEGEGEGGGGSPAIASFLHSSSAYSSHSHASPSPPSIRLHATHAASIAIAAAPPDAFADSFTENEDDPSLGHAEKSPHHSRSTTTPTKGTLKKKKKSIPSSSSQEEKNLTRALLPSSVLWKDSYAEEANRFALPPMPKEADEEDEQEPGLDDPFVEDRRPTGEANRSTETDSPPAASTVPPPLSSSSSSASTFSFSKPTSPRAFRYIMLQKERETSALRDTNARQQSMVSTLKESLQQVHQQLAKQAEWFAEERTQAEKDRDTQLSNVMEQLRVVRHSAEILLSEKRSLLEESKRQQAQLLSVVEQERREKENIMQEYRDKTESIITQQGQEITRLRRKLVELEEALELWKIQQIAKEEDWEKLQDAHRIVLREKEELKGTLTRLQQRHLQESQEREAAEAKAREVGFKGMEETVERNRKLTQQLQTLEQQLQEQRRAHEGQEEKLLEAHRQERHTLEERLRSVIAEREAAVENATAQQNRTAELHQLRTSLETEMKEKLQQVQGEGESALRDVQQKWHTAEEKWAVEREKLESTLVEQAQQLQRLQLTHQERQKSTTTLQQELRERSWQSAQEQLWREMLESRGRLANAILLEQASLHLSGQAALHDTILLAPLRATIDTMETLLREREMSMQHVLATERQRHEDSVVEMEKILVELRVDRHRAQTMATQYLKELTAMHREKEQSRVHLEGEVEKLEKRITILEKELQYREMVNTEQQGTMKMLHGRLENYERENKSLHEEVLEQSQKIQEAHIWLGRKDAGINQLRAQLRAFEATSHGGRSGSSKKMSGSSSSGGDGAVFFSSTTPKREASSPPGGKDTKPMLKLSSGEEQRFPEIEDG